jgi:hypothetical protein
MPRFRNDTPVSAELVPMIDNSGRNVAVIIVKGTYDISTTGELGLASPQTAISFVDEYYDPPSNREIRTPSDLVHQKLSTDILLVRSEPDSERQQRQRAFSVTVGPVRISARFGDKWEVGPLSRNQEPRRSFAGTYDENWVKQRMPLLPEDFDLRYNHSARADQNTTGYLSGDEPFAFTDLYAAGHSIRGSLPGKAVVVATSVLSVYYTAVAALDTVLVSSDKPRMTLVWRHLIVPKQKIEEIGQTNVYLARLRSVRELYELP